MRNLMRCLIMIKSLIKGVDMSRKLAKTRILGYGLMICFLAGCFHPPYNNFQPDRRAVKRVGVDTGIGAVAGVIASGTASGTLIGAAAGGTVGLVASIYRDSKRKIIRDLQKQDIQYVEYGDTRTLIIPTDKYFMFSSPRLNEICYPGLNNIIRLLNFYPQSTIYVAGFTDNVGSRSHKRKLSQAQAETMMTFLWANGIAAKRLKAEGYGDKNAISDNAIIHGSAQNRRIEIQWFTSPAQPPQPQMAYVK
ncbi:TPA: OmpA family protein [Legionella pneumophila]|nr:OmpA family protein [Legionella pneumophila]HAT8814674.1 OmpA family protein [Legionella pneumophila subsp. pneumophila]HAT6824363.1 OmpA family protein [Legionella pneumophila]HAT6912425.1 OmpA family protein [Legionella pneumophila]HAT7813853.1 OmpA family protein [Legionella pneumophila]